IQAREQAPSAESGFAAWRSEMQAAQDRRLGRQNTIGRLRLELASAEHSLELADERAESHRAMAEALRRDDVENARQAVAAEALRGQLGADIERASRALEAVAPLPEAPVEVDPLEVQHTQRAAEQARRSVAIAASALAALRTRREFLEEQVARLEAGADAAGRIPAAETALAEARSAAAAAEAAAVSIGRLRSELEGLESLRPASALGLLRLGEVVTAEPGYERALAATLGPLADALVAPGGDAAARAGDADGSQRTVLYPIESVPEPKPGSMFHHVRIRTGYDLVARRLLGHVVVGVDVTIAGLYREPGMVRAGADPRLEIDARRARLNVEIDELSPAAAEAQAAAGRVRTAEAALDELRRRAAGATSLDESRRL